MASAFTLAVQGGTIHTVPLAHLGRMQDLVSELGAASYPLFLRLGAVRHTELQPVTVLALLTEVEKFSPLIADRPVAGVSFYDAAGQELGRISGGVTELPLAQTKEAALAVTPEGIRVVVEQFPPPVGFRSGPGLESGWFECYFASLELTPDGALGRRMAAMGGSGTAVRLPNLPPIPPATKWHQSRVSSGVPVASVAFTPLPASEAFRDILHAITAACTESLRLKRPLRMDRG